MTEEWRRVVGWPDYEVSNLGRVRRHVVKLAREYGVSLGAINTIVHNRNWRQLTSLVWPNPPPAEHPIMDRAELQRRQDVLVAEGRAIK